MQLGCICLFFKGMQQILKQKIRLLNKRDENLEVIVFRRLRRLAMTFYYPLGRICNQTVMNISICNAKTT